MRYELFLALRYLFAKRKQTFISLISLISVAGVALGVTALIIAQALVTGFQEDIQAKVLGSNSHITVFSGWGGRGIQDPQGLMARIRQVPGVGGTAPLVVEKGLLLSDGNSTGNAAVIHGIDPDLQPAVTTLQEDLRRAALGRETPGPETPGPEVGLHDLRPAIPAGRDGGPLLATVFLGHELAFRLGVGRGDRVKLIVPQARLSPFGVRPKSVSYEVAGVTKSGFYDYDLTRVYMHLEEARRLFSMGGTVTAVQVKLFDLGRMEPVKADLRAQLGEGFWVTDLLEQNQAFFSALKMEKLISFLVITLIVLVAAMNIVSTLILMVMEKVRDIGALISMGATSRGIMLLFQLQGVVIGVVGTVIGCAAGLAVSWTMDTYQFWPLDPDVYFISYLPFKVRLLDFSLAVALALSISFVATLYPAWRASRLKPVEALRYE